MHYLKDQGSTEPPPGWGGGLIDGAQSYRMHLLYGFTPLRLLLTCSRIQIHSHWLVCKY